MEKINFIDAAKTLLKKDPYINFTDLLTEYKVIPPIRQPRPSIELIEASGYRHDGKGNLIGKSGKILRGSWDSSIKNPETKLMYFTGINNSRFKKTVTPGDQIHFEVSLDKFRLGTCKIIGIAKVNNQIVAEAEILASVVERKS